MPRKKSSLIPALTPKQQRAEALLQAVLEGDGAGVKKCLKEGGDVNQVLAQRRVRPADETALMVAAELGHLRLVKLLLALGADVQAENLASQQALLYAVRGGHTSIAACLLKAGADPNSRKPGDESVLMVAVRADNSLALTKLLLRAGADPNAKNYFGGTALHLAAHWGNLAVAKLLLQAGADINAKQPQWGGALYSAIMGKQSQMIRFLLSAGTKSSLQPQALGLAAWDGQLATVALLIEHGFDVNSKAYQGRTPLRHAKNRKHRKIAELLVAAGAQG